MGGLIKESLDIEVRSLQLTLLTLRDKIAEKTGFVANASIMNFYPDGSDHISWHADDEKFLEEKTVAGIRFCCELVFQ